MILQEKTVAKWTDEINFKRAKQLYESGCVGLLDIKKQQAKRIGFGDKIVVNGTVTSFNGFKINQVVLNFNQASNSVEIDCDCEEQMELQAKGSGLCKHIAAVMLMFIHEYQNNDGYKRSKSDIDNLLEQLESNSQLNEELKRELQLEINFFKSRSDYRPYIELRIGVEKLYTVKSMRSFLTSLINGGPIEFGKNFTYNPNYHSFNETDQGVIEMLMEIKDIEGDKRQNDYYNYYTSSMFAGKSVAFSGKTLLRFFKLAKNRRINAIIEGRSSSDVSIVEEKMPVKFNLEMKNEEIELSQNDEIPIALNEDCKVFWYGGKFYLPPKEQLDTYLPIAKLMQAKNRQKVIFRKEDSNKIASHLLPKLKSAVNEVVLDKKLKDRFYEASLTPKFYFDKDDIGVKVALKFAYEDLEFNPLDNNDIESGDKILIRDIKKEEDCKNILVSFGFEKENKEYRLKKEELIVALINEGTAKLQKLGEVYYSTNFKNIKILGKSSIKAGITINEKDYLEFTFELEGVSRQEYKTLMAAIREKKKYYKLKDGSFVDLTDGLNDIGDMIEFLNIKDKDLEKDNILISKYNALYLDQKFKDHDMSYVKRSKNFKELTSNIREIKDMDFDVPDSLKGVLRNYQVTGFKWFSTLAMYGFGGILADEMGLGKTLQTIAFLLSQRGENPSLIIVPTSLVYNWQSEIEKFAPELKAVVVSGSKKQRDELRNEIDSSDVVITSYPLIRRDIDEYKDINFNYCILDEAQQIKNPTSINATAVKEIKAKTYFALTGTPMENSLTELWSIFDFIMPGYLLSLNKFTKLYETKIIKQKDKTALMELNRRTKPFILRRLKSDVVKELPPKIEHKIVVDMTDEQKKLYAAYVASAKNEIDEEIKANGFNKSKMKILSILTRLRQICCDPSVFIEDYTHDNGKMQALDEILENSIQEGHKILLFSQFTTVLKNIKTRLNKTNIKYMYLDGSVKSEDRMDMVKAFNTGETEVFLISLKAGGTGLNLTGADIVIHYDPWWNPAVEEQATDRAHRIGQEKTVEVIKLLTKGTIEEKIYNLQQRKKEMIQRVIDDNLNEDNVITKMTQEDLEGLFE